MNELMVLNDLGYNVSYQNSQIFIIKPNKKNIIGIGLITISVITTILAFAYLTLNQTEFNPLIFRVGISMGIFLFFVGVSIRSKRNSDNVTIDLKAKQLSVGGAKNSGEGAKYKYSYSEISNLRILTSKQKSLCLIKGKQQDVMLFKFNSNIDKHKTEQLMLELEELLYTA